MGREIKRVQLDFDWPMGERWPGYLVSFCLALDLEEASRNCPIFDYLDPPKGEGYQLWETTSEGSPISPVFATPEELAHWLTDNKASAFARMTLSYEKWLAFISCEECFINDFDAFQEMWDDYYSSVL